MDNNEINITDEAIRVLLVEARAVEALAGRIDANFERAAKLISKCEGRLVVTGMGKSGLVGCKIAATMASTGTPSFFLHPAEASHGDLGMVTQKDVVLALSNSGETAEIIALLPFIKRFGVKLVSMTGKPDSTLARASDVTLDVSVEEEACPMGLAPTASTTAAMAMGDALAVVLLVMKGLSEQDFATFHPSGSLGKKLLVTVGDLMHSGTEMPTVRLSTPMTETVVEVSAKRLGIALVLTDEGGLAGVFTDGDLRRGIEKHGQGLFGQKVRDVMTMDPKTITPKDLAAKALGIMEQYSITALPVVDDDGKPAGIVHLHDILREGIV